MSTFILIIIYVAFISLGLPDSLLGSAWPVMQQSLHMPLSAAGLISMIITGGTIISSFLSGRLIKWFGTGKLTCASVLLTAVSLFGFSVSSSFYWLCLLALPLGLGAGAVDAALNHFVALHYKAKHMSWLHCFWGIGATSGPFIMSMYLMKESGWRGGYSTIAVIQFVLVAVLLFTLPVWKKFGGQTGEDDSHQEVSGKQNLYAIPGVKVALLSFFCYCGAELTIGLWGSSYLVISRGMAAEKAAKWISLFYLGITLGRLISGFISIKFSNKELIRIGQGIMVLGTVVFMAPLPTEAAMVGFILLGLGCAPIYPSMLHDTPKRFGTDVSQSLMGIQMAFAYMGSTAMPPLFGFMASAVGTGIFPAFLLLVVLVMFVCVEYLNKKLKGV